MKRASPRNERVLRVIPIPRAEPDLKLVAQALLAIVEEQRQKAAMERGRNAHGGPRGNQV
jgi:hypothetical protein